MVAVRRRSANQRSEDEVWPIEVVRLTRRLRVVEAGGKEGEAEGKEEVVARARL